MKRGMLCLLLLLYGCSKPDSPTSSEFALTWTCLSPEGCERTDEVVRIDRMELVFEDRACHFTSTQDQAFAAQGQQIFSDLLPPGCSWLYFLSLFGHELERSRLCLEPGGMELELSIPNQDPATNSIWRVRGLDLDIFDPESAGATRGQQWFPRDERFL